MDVATTTSLPGEHGDPTPDLPFKRLCLMEHNWVRRASQETCGRCSGPYKYDVWHILIQHAVWGDTLICSYNGKQWRREIRRQGNYLRTTLLVISLVDIG